MAKLNEKDLETAFRLLCAGSSVRSIARSLSVSTPGLSRRLIKRYGQDYLLLSKPSPTSLLLAEYSQSHDRRIREAAQQFASSYALEPQQESDRSFLTLAEERNRSGRENYLGLNLNYLDTRKGRGVCKLC